MRAPDDGLEPTVRDVKPKEDSGAGACDGCRAQPKLTSLLSRCLALLHNGVLTSGRVV